MPSVLLVDDSVLARVLLQQRFRRHGWQVKWARDGMEALGQWQDEVPDLITMDVEMPRLGGVEAVRRLRQEGYRGPLIMLSSYTRSGAEITLEALAAGADDFVLKPSSPGELDEAVERLVEKWEALARVHPALPEAGDQAGSSGALDPSRVRCWCLVASTGGPRALTELFRGAPKPPVPVVVVQHMPPGFTQAFSQRLSREAGFEVREVTADGPPCGLDEAPAWLAPGGRHLRMTASTVWAEVGPRRHGVIPAADVTLEDAVGAFGGNLGVLVLTGMGEDGAEGARQAHRKGAIVIAEDPSTAVVWGMPRAVVESGAADVVWPLPTIRRWLHAAWRVPAGRFRQ
ncbi:MAG: response regulator [Dehalococcoidia bacterium]|nr:response regulator [Dehalococcoidia bacterium]